MQKYLYQDLYDLEDNHWWHISKGKLVLKLAQEYKSNSSSLKILDVGCGTGKNMENLKSLGSTWGIDMSTTAIKFCKKRGLKNVLLGRAEKIPFKKNTFDLITLLDVLEHTDDGKTLQEVHRVLKPNGLLIITVPAFQFLWSKWDAVLHHKRRYTKKNLSDVLIKNAFSITKSNYVYSFLVVPILVIRSVKSITSKQEYSSDFKLSSPLINKIMCYICFVERRLANLIPMPFGTSLITLARKKQ